MSKDDRTKETFEAMDLMESTGPIESTGFIESADSREENICR